jgi:hypothetical protein
MQSAMKEVNSMLLSATSPLTEPPALNDFVCVVIDAGRYRARIVSQDPEEPIQARLVDYDEVVTVHRDEIYELPPRLAPIEPQGLTVCLAFVKDEAKLEVDLEYVRKATQNLQLFMRLAYVASYPGVLLFDRPDLEACTLNAMVLTYTSAVSDNLDVDVDDDIVPVLDAIKRIQGRRPLGDI